MKAKIAVLAIISALVNLWSDTVLRHWETFSVDATVLVIAVFLLAYLYRTRSRNNPRNLSTIVLGGSLDNFPLDNHTKV